MALRPLHTTLEQELQALIRGVSLECLVCGEFVLRTGRTLSCPECSSHLRDVRDSAQSGLQFHSQAG
jgi:Zn finger protein HypA/HybF involved in hydrogenase expression